MKTVYNSRILLPTPRHRAARRTRYIGSSVRSLFRSVLIISLSSASSRSSPSFFFALRRSRALRLGSRRLASRRVHSTDVRPSTRAPASPHSSSPPPRPSARKERYFHRSVKKRRADLSRAKVTLSIESNRFEVEERERRRARQSAGDSAESP